MRGWASALKWGPDPSSLRSTPPLEDLAVFYVLTYILQQGLQLEVQNLKDQVQELHRDLTKHHSLIKAEIMGDILHRSLRLDTQIASEHASMEGMRAIFQEVTCPSSINSRLQKAHGYPKTGKGESVWRGALPDPHAVGSVPGGFPLEKCGPDWCVWLCSSQSRITVSEITPAHLKQHATPLFQIWEDSYQRVATQQEIYEGPWQRLSVLIPIAEGGSPLTMPAHPCSPPPVFGLDLTPALEGRILLSGMSTPHAAPFDHRQSLAVGISRWYQA